MMLFHFIFQNSFQFGGVHCGALATVEFKLSNMVKNIAFHLRILSVPLLKVTAFYAESFWFILRLALKPIWCLTSADTWTLR